MIKQVYIAVDPAAGGASAYGICSLGRLSNGDVVVCLYTLTPVCILCGTSILLRRCLGWNTVVAACGAQCVKGLASPHKVHCSRKTHKLIGVLT